MVIIGFTPYRPVQQFGQTVPVHLEIVIILTTQHPGGQPVLLLKGIEGIPIIPSRAHERFKSKAGGKNN